MNATRQRTDGSVHILKTGTCPSLSGKSKLSYEIGCSPTGDLGMRVCKNSGNGYFSKQWVGWDQVQAVLDQHGDKPITFHTLSPLFEGRSINTAGFLLAALKQEGLVQKMEDQPRCYERVDATSFLAGMRSLVRAVGNGPPPPPAAKPGAPSKKAAGKGRSLTP